MSGPLSPLIQRVVAFCPMRCSMLCVALILSTPGFSRDHPPVPLPGQFEVARHTFFDVGPPSDFYELFLVRPTGNVTSIERITLTPAGDACIQPAKVETASASVGESVAALLGTKNPCTIPEKELGRELKRCKKCLVFSGADVVMQFHCGTQTRTIRANILDKDMFDPAANTPEHTSWTMRLLERMDHLVGPGVMEQPMFALPGADQPSATNPNSAALRDVSSGKYDSLFQGAPDKPSDLDRDAQLRPPSPSVQLLSSSPFRPDVFVQPEYPPLARAAHIEGTVAIKVEIDSNGSTTNLAFESGHVMLRGSVKEAVSGWKFPKEAAHQEIQATIEFKTNCPAQRR
jgi:TonB family protein